MSESLVLRGTLRGHKGWVTQLSTSPKFPDMILSASRDKSLIIWKLTRLENSRIWIKTFSIFQIFPLQLCNHRDDGGSYGTPHKRLHGHGHFVSDVTLSSDGNFALSGSWDKTMRLGDLPAGKTSRR